MNMRRCRMRRALISLPLVAALVALAACATPATHTPSLPEGRNATSGGEHTHPDPLVPAAAHVEAIGGRAAVEAYKTFKKARRPAGSALAAKDLSMHAKVEIECIAVRSPVTRR